ncbi:putative disease resistance RPP13-like protein 1 [Citrus sinensis]|nr:putative disease resistance RPP13-like protein 1 [Citrus sinensis]
MPSRIKDIIGRLDRLCKQRNDLGLQLTPAVTSSSTAARRPDSSSVPKECVVYGREDDKAKVLEMVLSDEPSVANVRVIPIVGMGGVGKTTLARKVYNDTTIIDYKFDLKAWVCVFDNFNVLSISKKLLPSITSKACDLNTLNEVQIKLKEAANGKKILIVLDDVWNVDYRLWETLKLRSLLLYHPEKELVLLWKVEGLIRQPRNNKQLEEWGNKSFHDLVSRSIFQQSHADCSKFVMHDLVHDLAQLISGETIFRLEEAGDLSRRKEKVRHSSFPRSDYDNKSRFQFLIRVEHLRTFLPVVISGGSYCGYISNMVVCDLLPRFKKLRVLSLEGYYVTRLPNSITKLRLLTYLNLSGTEIRCLPESTSSLLYLQILKLRDCLWLIKLPSRMRKLINLHHLNLRGAYKLDNMPLGMKKLKNLQTLSNFIVGKSGSRSRLNDLKDLNFLGGALCISGLENMENMQDAREAMLSKKQNLEELSLEWGFNNSRDEVVEGNVLDMLQPHISLKILSHALWWQKISFLDWRSIVL